VVTFVQGAGSGVYFFGPLYAIPLAFFIASTTALLSKRILKCLKPTAEFFYQRFDGRPSILRMLCECRPCTRFISGVQEKDHKMPTVLSKISRFALGHLPAKCQ
jgi:hypothetical protein